MGTTTRPAAAPGRTPIRRWQGDLTVLGVEVALVALAALVGAMLNARGVGLHADAAPLYATWRPHAGWGTPAAVLVALAVAGPGMRWAQVARWGPLLGAAWLAAGAWTLSLALVDGWSAGFTERLTVQAEYLHEVPGIRNVPAALAGFAGRILDFQPDSWSTHTAGHPPGALLVFVALDRIGLGGGTAAALACVLVGTSVTVSVPVAVRALGAEPAARAVLPFLVLLPGAVWVGASADGLFAGVVAAGLALLAVRGRLAPAAGGLVLGFALYLSYGFVLVGLLALVVLALRPGHRVPALLAGIAGAATVVIAATAAGFWWWDGYQRVVERYYQGWAADRPYGYWVWTNLAALVLSAGPALGPALRRAVRAGVAALRPALRGPGLRLVGPVIAAGPAVLLPVAAAVVVLAADLSGLSKAEVERIWLPFAVWLLVATAHLPPATRRWWLAGQAATALAVNHLVFTVS
ncbi:hypothetical protein GA0074695_3463 [Micromonospora viridifaciens]|uniref:Integral membrane protein n=1 Tax=Micromonospora viridifaciens TaxID=1881 RepID=A0A1C4XMY8_MICVI|nr:hypothetical protein [Micromonospora viridifaciens]SCF09909.1 hypothetical protein GA0074695_3463 [Micromonospora viridifaciens]